MTQVDFYILDSDSDDARLLLACKIVDKAMQLDHHVYIHSTSDDEARKLDELLWTFSQGSFIPHLVVLDRHGKLLASSMENGKYIGPERALKRLEELLATGIAK